MGAPDLAIFNHSLNRTTCYVFLSLDYYLVRLIGGVMLILDDRDFNGLNCTALIHKLEVVLTEHGIRFVCSFDRQFPDAKKAVKCNKKHSRVQLALPS